MTLLLNAFSICEPKLYYRLCFIEGNLSETRCIETCSLCLCLCVNIFCLHSLKLLSPKHSSFVCRLNGHRAELPTTSVVPSAHRSPRRGPPEAHSGRRVSGEKAPEAKRRCTVRRATATSRLRSCCSRKAPRWTPRPTVAGASMREAGARNRVSNLAHFKIRQECFGFEIPAFSVNVWQSRGFALLVLGSVITHSMSVSQSCSQKIDDHFTRYLTFLMTLLLHAFSICEQQLEYHRLCFIEGNLSETRCIETCSLCLCLCVNIFCFAQLDCVKTKTMSFVVDWTGGAQLRSWTWFQVMLLTIRLSWWHCFN